MLDSTIPPKLSSRRRRIPGYLYLLVLILSTLPGAYMSEPLSEEEINTCEAVWNDPEDSSMYRRRIGTLRPKDLPPLKLYTNFTTTATMHVGAGDFPDEYLVHEGQVRQVSAMHDHNVTTLPATLSFIPDLLPKSTAHAIRKLLKSSDIFLDEEPDSVDALPTFEIFMDSPLVESQRTESESRASFRKEFQSITRPFIEQVVTPLVREYYPDVCKQSVDRLCQACYSLVRRYRHGERQTHATHQDGHALVTVVISLSKYDIEYRGGLYVTTGHGGLHEYLKLNVGDAVIHRSHLFHGVRIWDLEPPSVPEQTERWSWILWFQDSADCSDDYGHEWFAECAQAGDAVCQFLHSTKEVPGESQEEENERILNLTRDAANSGIGEAALKMARGYLHFLPSSLEYDETLVEEFYRKGIDSGNPDSHYGMAQLLLIQLGRRQAMVQETRDKFLREAIHHLEEAALRGNTFAMYNLGIAHAFGYGGLESDVKVSHSWFVECGLPECLYFASRQAKAVTDTEAEATLLQQTLLLRAKKLGLGTPWRREAREQTGSGGSGGVDLNLPWPVSPMGSRPPRV